MKPHSNPNDFVAETDSRAIQMAINDAIQSGSGKVIIPRLNQHSGKPVWEITEPIFLPSNIHVVLDNCHLRLADGVFCNIFCNSNAYVDPASEQENIAITGRGTAILDGGNHNGLTEKTSGKDGMPHIIYNTALLFCNVKHFTIENLHVHNQRWWGMTFLYSSIGRISNITFFAQNSAPNQDGIDLRVGCSQITIENINGQTGDDTVALTALSGQLESMFSIPDRDTGIHDIMIQNIQSYISGGHNIVRLLNQDGNKLYNIMIDTVQDVSSGVRPRSAIIIGDPGYASVRRAAEWELYGITIQNIYSRAEYAVRIGGSLSNACIRNIHLTDSCAAAIRIADTTVSNLLIDGIFAHPGEPENALFVSERAKGRYVAVKNVFPNGRQITGLDDSVFDIEKQERERSHT